jgi:hypothetical protein
MEYTYKVKYTWDGKIIGVNIKILTKENYKCHFLTFIGIPLVILYSWSVWQMLIFIFKYA